MGRHRQHRAAARAAAGLATALAACTAAAGPLAAPGTAGAAAKHKATSDKKATSASSKPTVQVSSEPGVGEVLVNSAGQTLYLFAPDKRKKPTCTGACASAWPPLTVTGKPVAGKGIDKKLLGTDKNPDGQRQVTYNHWPLYTYVADTAPGEVRGQGVSAFGGKWWTVDKKGKEVTAHASSTGGSSAGSSGGSYGGSHSTSSSTTNGGGYGY